MASIFVESERIKLRKSVYKTQNIALEYLRRIDEIEKAVSTKIVHAKKNAVDNLINSSLTFAQQEFTQWTVR